MFRYYINANMSIVPRSKHPAKISLQAQSRMIDKVQQLKSSRNQWSWLTFLFMTLTYTNHEDGCMEHVSMARTSQRK